MSVTAIQHLGFFLCIVRSLHYFAATLDQNFKYSGLYITAPVHIQRSFR